jgi:protein TonB
VSSIRLPLTLSVAGHALGLAAAALFLPGRLALPPEPVATSGIEVEFEPAPPKAEVTPAAPAPTEPEVTPPPVAVPPPPEPAPQPAAVAPPEPSPAAAGPVPLPPAPVPESSPLPRPKPHRAPVRLPPKPAPRHREAAQPAPAYTPMPTAPLPAPPAAPVVPRQTAVAALPGPAATASPEARARYGALVSAWLEAHKRYPEPARQRDEQGSAVLRIVVDHSGRVLHYAVASSTGYPDLDQSIEEMMSGAAFPPFPADMPEPRIEFSVTVRFRLMR